MFILFVLFITWLLRPFILFLVIKALIGTIANAPIKTLKKSTIAIDGVIKKSQNISTIALIENNVQKVF